jgi:hypothetical protein
MVPLLLLMVLLTVLATVLKNRPTLSLLRWFEHELDMVQHIGPWLRRNGVVRVLLVAFDIEVYRCT